MRLRTFANVCIVIPLWGSHLHFLKRFNGSYKGNEISNFPCGWLSETVEEVFSKEFVSQGRDRVEIVFDRVLLFFALTAEAKSISVLSRSFPVNPKKMSRYYASCYFNG